MLHDSLFRSGFHVRLFQSHLTVVSAGIPKYKNTQQLIHEKLIEKAKERLIITHLSVSEIAYEPGFEHSQSFNKLFKNKTNVTPLEFRSSFR